MPDDPEQRFKRIQTLLLREPINRVQVSAEITVLHREFLDTLERAAKHDADIHLLEEKLKKVSEPPLIHSVLIGASQLGNGTFVVSVNGKRLDVGLAPSSDAPLQVEDLRPGDEVLVTRDSNVIVGRLGPERRGEAAEVREVLADPLSGKPDRLLVRHSGSDGIVVELSDSLKKLADLPLENKEKLKAGDRVTIDSSSRIAFEKLPSHETGSLELEEDPKARYEDVAGLEPQIQLIRDVIEMPYLERDRFRRYGLKRPHGVLLYGPPGCGKTMIAAAAANGLRQSIAAQLAFWTDRVTECRSKSKHEASQILSGAPPELGIEPSDAEGSLRRLEALRRNVHSYFFNIKGPELLSKWVGEAESRVRQIFAEAKARASYTCPVIVFFDEIESMFQRRGSGVSSDMEKTMVPQILTELDGVVELENVIVIGASNRHELLDPALLRPGRLDMKIKIDRPDRAAAAAIFKVHLRPPGVADGEALPLSPEALGEETGQAFESEMRAALAKLQGCGFVMLDGGATPAESIPLERAFTRKQANAVIGKLRTDGRVKGRLDDVGRCVRYSDVARALEAVWREDHADDDRRFHAVIALDSGQAVAETRLPVFPLEAGGDSTAPLLDQLIDVTVDTLFSPRSFLRARVLAACGREHNFLLGEFVSGALIANVVARAKRAALRREVGSDPVSSGLSAGDLLAAVRDEYSENKDQFVANKPEITDTFCETCKRRHSRADEYEVEVLLGRSPRDRWGVSRNRPYERGRGMGVVARRHGAQ